MSSSMIRNRALSNDEAKDNIAMLDLKPAPSHATSSVKSNDLHHGIIERMLNKILLDYSAIGEVISLFGEAVKKVTSYTNIRETHMLEVEMPTIKTTDRLEVLYMIPKIHILCDKADSNLIKMVYLEEARDHPTIAEAMQACQNMCDITLPADSNVI